MLGRVSVSKAYFRCFVPGATEQIVLFFGMEKVMSKQQALLETLLGATELNGNRMVADRIRHDIFKITRSHKADGYRRLARVASEPKRPHCRAA